MAFSGFGLVLAELDLFLNTLQLVFGFDFFFDKPCSRLLLRFCFLPVLVADILLTRARSDSEVD